MVKSLAGTAAGAAMLVCLWTPVAYFRGSIGEAAFHGWFVAASLVWFVAATIFASRK